MYTFTDWLVLHVLLLPFIQSHPSRSYASSSDGEPSADKKRRFEEMRKAHYNMKTALQQGKALLSSQDGGNEAEDDGEGEVEGRHMGGGEDDHTGPSGVEGVNGTTQPAVAAAEEGEGPPAGGRRASRVSWGVVTASGGEGGGGREGEEDMEVEHGDWGDSHRGGKRANMHQDGGPCGGTSSSS